MDDNRDRGCHKHGRQQRFVAGVSAEVAQLFRSGR
jgi:hypothetical protein